MAKKATPIITHTEIIALAIRSVEADIDEWRQKFNGNPDVFMTGMFEIATAELREKLDALKTLYRIETGVEFE